MSLRHYINQAQPAFLRTGPGGDGRFQRRFGLEQLARLTVNVKPNTGGTPAGTVTVLAGQTSIAVVTLKHGKATWTFPPKKLQPGTYQLTGTYTSSNGYNSATTAKKKFVVTR